MQLYLVGGAVRDELLGLPVHDRDWVVVGATPEAMLAQGFKPVGADFPVFLHPDTHEEYALARSEKKVAPGYQGFVFQTDIGVTLEEDLMRRDLTINAMAKADDGSLVDPYAGQADIERRQLRHVSRAFVEDPVRCLRLARFMARFAHLDFTVADETKALVAEMVNAGEVDALVPERVWAEMQRALTAQQPQQFFQVLAQLGVAVRIHPALSAIAEVVPGYADVGALDALNTWAVYLHEVEAGDDLAQHLRLPNEYRHAARKLRYVAVHADASKMRDASAWLTLLTQLDGVRQQDFLLSLRPAVAWLEAEATLPVGFTACLFDALACVVAVKGRDLDLQGKAGPEIRAVIDAERERRLAELLASR